MGLRGQWRSLRASDHTSNDNGSSREGDSSGGPKPDRQPRGSWPTLVIESGVSQSLPDLRNTIRWWFSASGHAVKIVLLVKLNRSSEEIIIEKWTEGPANPRIGATSTRPELSLTPSLRQSIHIDMTPEAKQAASGDPIRSDLSSYIVTTGDLRLEFQLLFLRMPMEGEGDVVITEEMLRVYGREMWDH